MIVVVLLNGAALCVAQENKPLHSFEDNSDYVLDARWSPVHPALFATVDCNGRLDMWNLNNDTEVRACAREHMYACVRALHPFYACFRV